MLKAEVAGIGFPEKGTPQGGIISPLLSNIVLNELDWWIASQWETMPTKHEYQGRKTRTDNSSKYRALRTSKLKECYLVRYADDFKILCRYQNLLLIDKRVHILLHATKAETIEKYLGILNLSKAQLNKLNTYRATLNLNAIETMFSL